MNNKSYTFGTGTSLVILVFVMLCFTTFALFTVLYSKVSYENSIEYNNKVIEYYKADNIANQKLLELMEIKNNQDINFKEIILSKGYEITDNEIVYSIFVNDNSNLYIKLNIDDLSINTWKLKISPNGEYQEPSFIY